MSSREAFEPHKGDIRYVRRDSHGRLTEKQVNAGRSLAIDRPTEAKTTVPKRQSDRGDEKRN